MEISILLMEQIAELFLMILMGYIIVKTGLLKGEDSKVISKIVLYLVIPCVIINAFQVDYTSEKVKELLLVFAGVVLFFTKIRLPEIVDQALSSVGSMIGPASMIVTGMLIAEMNLRNIFENVKVYFISFLRLVVIPVISLAILKISGLVNIHPDGKKLLLIVFLAVITPSASTITQMCQVYGNDSKYASAINVMTTLLSIITMPLMVLLYQTMM